MQYIPHDYQAEVKEFLMEPGRQEAGLFLDCGLGKTVITLDALYEWIVDLDCKGVLIVAPLRVARLVWPLELLKWDHLNWMSYSFIHGKDKLAKLKTKAEIYTINYEGLLWLAEVLKKVPPEKWPFDTIVWDELTKMKSHSSKRYKMWKSLIPKFKRRIGLTGTPTPKSLLDLFAQAFVLDAGKRLGRAYTRFRDRFFEQADYMGYNYDLRPGADKKIYELIGDLVIRMSAEDHLDLIPPEFIDIDLKLDTQSKKQYKQLEKEMFLQLESTDIEVFNAAALTNKCLQFASGSMYTDDEGSWVSVHEIKLKALEEIFKKHPDDPILIAYNFRHEAEQIKSRFPEVVFLQSGMSEKDELQLQEDWNAGKILRLACHPASAGHGLNFQYGGHIAVWMTLNWSLELYIQLNKRLDRQGQTEKPLFYRLIMEDTVDEAVATALQLKDDTQTSLLRALQVYRENH